MARKRRWRKKGECQYQLGPAAVYSRVSNPSDTKFASLESQETATAEMLREAGYTVTDADVYRDRFTGRETIRRPELNRMRERIVDGYYKAVGVYKLDRLSRNQGQTYHLLSEMDQYNVRPLSVLEPNIDKSPEGKIYRMLGSYMAEADIASMEDRVGRGRDYIAAQGKPVGCGPPPFGLNFDKSTRTYSANQHEEWARRIFVMAAGGSNCNQIAKEFNALGVPPPGIAGGQQYQKRGHLGRWNRHAVRRIIRNPMYKGWVIENRYYSAGVADAGHSIIRRAPEEEWTIHDREGAIAPRLVTEELWATANTVVDANARNSLSSGKKVHEHLLRGMIYCAECGAKRYGVVTRHGRTHYKCSNYDPPENRRVADWSRCPGCTVQASWIEPHVWRKFEGLVLNPGACDEAIRKMLAGHPRDTSATDLALARRNLGDQERVREKFYRLWREEEARVDADPDLAAKWQADYRAMRGMIESLKATVAALEKQVSAVVAPEELASQVADKFAIFRDLYARGAEPSATQKREGLLLAGAVVVVKGNGELRPDRAGGSGHVVFRLFSEVVQPVPSRWRCDQLEDPLSIAVELSAPNL